MAVDDPVEFEAKRNTLELFETALDHFFAREFREAAILLDELLERNPEDRTARLFRQKAEVYLGGGVPADWTGVEVMEAK